MNTYLCAKQALTYSKSVYIFTLVCIQQILAKCPPFVAKEMKHFKIIPDLLDTPPPFGCQVDWGGSDADFGNRLEPHEVAREPKETIWPTDPGRLYTLMMVDLDAPTPRTPSLRAYLHWLVVNIPEDLFMNGECIAPYLNPDCRIDPHRLAFLVFEQPNTTHINFETLTKHACLEDNIRGKFSWREFAKKWNLGSPYAINFFHVERPTEEDRRASIHTMNDKSDPQKGGWFNFMKI